ncbi:hypothetical protein PFISCL1PPCAC_26505, partial [Pristionchus fissidentatus]
IQMRLRYLTLLALLAGIAVTQSASDEGSVSREVQPTVKDSAEAQESSDDSTVSSTIDAPPTEKAQIESGASLQTETSAESNSQSEEELNSDEVNQEFNDFRESSSEESAEQEPTASESESTQEEPVNATSDQTSDVDVDGNEQSETSDDNGESHPRTEEGTAASELTSSEEIEEEPEIEDGEDRSSEKEEEDESVEKGSQELSDSEEVEEEPEMEDTSDETDDDTNEEQSKPEVEPEKPIENEVGSEVKEEIPGESENDSESEKTNGDEFADVEKVEEEKSNNQELSDSEEVEEEPELDDEEEKEDDSTEEYHPGKEASYHLQMSGDLDDPPVEEEASVSENQNEEKDEQPVQEGDTKEDHGAEEPVASEEPIHIGTTTNVEQEIAVEAGGALESAIENVEATSEAAPMSAKRVHDHIVDQAEAAFKEMMNDENSGKKQKRSEVGTAEVHKIVHDMIVGQALGSFKAMIEKEKLGSGEPVKPIHEGATDNVQQAIANEVEGAFEKVVVTDKKESAEANQDAAAEEEDKGAEEETEQAARQLADPRTRRHTNDEIRAAIAAEAEKAFKRTIKTETKKDEDEELKAEPVVEESEEKEINNLMGDAMKENDEELVAKAEKEEEAELVRALKKRSPRMKRSDDPTVQPLGTTPVELPTETKDTTGKNENLPAAIDKDTPKSETSRQDEAPEKFTDEFGWTHYPWKIFPLKKTKFHREKHCGCQVMWIKQVYKRRQPKLKLLLVKSTYFNMHRPRRCGPLHHSHQRRHTIHKYRSVHGNRHGHMTFAKFSARFHHIHHSLPEQHSHWGVVHPHYHHKSKFIHKPTTKRILTHGNHPQFPWRHVHIRGTSTDHSDFPRVRRNGRVIKPSSHKLDIDRLIKELGGSKGRAAIKDSSIHSWSK